MVSNNFSQTMKRVSEAVFVDIVDLHLGLMGETEATRERWVTRLCRETGNQPNQKTPTYPNVVLNSADNANDGAA